MRELSVIGLEGRVDDIIVSMSNFFGDNLIFVLLLIIML